MSNAPAPTTPSPRASIGFVGLGYQGAPMARSIARAGRELIVFDLRPEAVEPFRNAGHRVAGTLGEVASGVYMVAFCVLDEAQVEKVALSDDGLLSTMNPGQVLVMHSTVSPALAVRLGAAAGARGIDFLDAPVSGSRMSARDECTLGVFVGGSPQAFQRAKPLFDAIGEQAQLLGTCWQRRGRKALQQPDALLHHSRLARGGPIGRCLRHRGK